MAVDSGSFSPISLDTNPYTQIIRKSLERTVLPDGVAVNDFAGDESVVASALQAGNKLLVLLRQGVDSLLVRYNSDGSLDSSFAEQGKLLMTAETPLNNSVSAIDIDVAADGDIVVTGRDSGVNKVWRYTADGDVDTRFGNNGVVTIDDSLLLSVRSLQVTADGVQLLGMMDGALQRVLSVTDGGAVTTSFTSAVGFIDSFPHDTVALLEQSDGSFLHFASRSYTEQAGRHVLYTWKKEFVVQRFNSDGSVDTTFGTDGYTVNSLASFVEQPSSFDYTIVKEVRLLADGKWIVAGEVHYQNALVRYNADGSIDSTFGQDGISFFSGSDVSDLTALDTGKLLVSTQTGLVQFNADGSLDTSFATDGFFTHSSLDTTSFFDGIVSHEVQADGSIIMVGDNDDDLVLLGVTEQGAINTAYAVSTRTTQSETVSNHQIQSETFVGSRGIELSALTVSAASGNLTTEALLREDDTGSAAMSVLLPVGVVFNDIGYSQGQTDAVMQDELQRIIYADDSYEWSEPSQIPRIFTSEATSDVSWLSEVNFSGSSANSTGTVRITGGDLGTNNTGALATVLDLTDLPEGVELQLDKVGLSYIKGEAVIRTDDSTHYIVTSGNAQEIYLGSGNDQVYGTANDDLLSGGDGDNLLDGGAGNDTLITGTGISQIRGEEGDDTFTTTSGGASFLYGDEGDDRFNLAPGNDSISGGSGNDTVVFSGVKDEYSIDNQNGVLYVSHQSSAADRLTLVNVETLQFGDQTIAVEYQSNDFAIVTLYRQILNRDADLGGYQYWSSQMDAGFKLGDAALAFLDSEEYRLSNNFAEMSVADQVETLYNGMLGRASDAPGKANWIHQINNGATVRDVATSFASSAELTANYIQAEQWNFDVTAWW